MIDIEVLEKPKVASRHSERTNSGDEKFNKDRTNINPEIFTLIAEGGDSFYRYLKSINLSQDPNLVILHSSHHFYYEEKELENVKTIVTVKRLNNIKNLEKFLSNLFGILQPNTNFVGCFSNDKTMNGNGFSNYPTSRLFKRFINFLDSKPDLILNKKEVSGLLEMHGFKLIDMTEMNGLTYFYSQKLHQKIELRA